MQHNWSKRWPTKPGYYWFYGWTSEHVLDLPAQIYFAEAKKVSNGTIYVANGRFIWKDEGAKGMWMHATLPDLPKEDE